MKAIKLLSIGVFLTGIMACAQKHETPKSVTDAFAKKFPTATSVKWDKENDSEWEAEFKMDAIEYSANFESNGTWKETEHEVKISEIPEVVKAALMKNYGDYRIKESEISESASGMVYEFEIKKGASLIEICIDSNGTITKKVLKVNTNESENQDD